MLKTTTPISTGEYKKKPFVSKRFPIYEEEFHQDKTRAVTSLTPKSSGQASAKTVVEAKTALSAKKDFNRQPIVNSQTEFTSCDEEFYEDNETDRILYAKYIRNGTKQTERRRSEDEKNEIEKAYFSFGKTSLFSSAKTNDEDDDDEFESNEYSRSEYKKMVLYYKSLYKSYKRQLVDSHRTIKELHETIEKLENKNWNHKQSRELAKLESSDEKSKLIIRKLENYCEKLNSYAISEDEEENRECVKINEKTKTNFQMMFDTLKTVIKEKQETRKFTKSFLKMVSHVNPHSVLVSQSMQHLNKVDLAKLNAILKETNQYLEHNSLAPSTYTCNCARAVNRTSNSNSEKSLEMVLANVDGNNNSKQIATTSREIAHCPSVPYVFECFTLFQELFGVDCYLNVPSKLNDFYYKYGQLANFKRAIQSIFGTNDNYSTERLVDAVQTIYDQLNERLEENLRKFFGISKLDKLADRFKIYNEYFPIFNLLLEEVMKTLEISRLDQIVPSIRALKILATPIKVPLKLSN